MTYRIEIKIEAPATEKSGNYRTIAFSTSMDSDLELIKIQREVVKLVDALTKE